MVWTNLQRAQRILSRADTNPSTLGRVLLILAAAVDRIEHDTAEILAVQHKGGGGGRPAGPPSIRYAEAVLQRLAPRVAADPKLLEVVAEVIDTARETRPPDPEPEDCGRQLQEVEGGAIRSRNSP